MKKKVLAWGTLSLAFLLVCGALLWWFLPLRVLRDVTDAELAYIEVFNGSTGKRFRIEDAAARSQLLAALQSPTYRREAYVGDRDGFSFSLTFYNGQSEVLERLTVNGERALVCGSFSCSPTEGILPFAYLAELEAVLAD